MTALFTKEEITHIEKNLNYITEKWYFTLVDKIIRDASAKGITNLYWNSSDTIDSGGTHEGKLNMFYEMIPKQLGFQSVQANLRGRGEERLWYKGVTPSKTKKSSQPPKAKGDEPDLIPLEKIPHSLRPKVIELLSPEGETGGSNKYGLVDRTHKGPYTKEELRWVSIQLKEVVKPNEEKVEIPPKPPMARGDETNLVELEKIPEILRGKVIGILSKGLRDERGRMIRHTGPYTQDEIRWVNLIINESTRDKRMREHIEKLKEIQRFSYDIGETWSGAQRFSNESEIIFKQKISRDELTRLLDLNDPVLDKFLSYIYSQSNHFEDNVIGFALISPLNETTWVLNEIQTDSINNYIGERKKALQQMNEPVKGNVLDADSVRDRLVAQGKSVWVDKLIDLPFLETLQNNPRIIDMLPDDAVVQEAGGIAEWLTKNPQHGFNLAKSKIRQILSACYVKRHRK